jgi:hypothetical protein
MKTRIIFSILFLCTISGIKAQDIDYARFLVKNLSSAEMKGRGYVDDGDKNAARFLASQMSKYELIPLSRKYLQEYEFSINSFPGKMNVWAGLKKIKPGADYLMALSSKGISSTFAIKRLLNDSLSDSEDFNQLKTQNLSNTIIITDKYHKNFADTNLLNAAGYVYVKDSSSHLIWKASNGKKLKDYYLLDIRKHIVDSIKSITLDFENKFLEDHKAYNVAGMVKGSMYPDSFFVFTAHFDHLGMMGEETMFPGASDNASGTAMMLDLARHFSSPANQPEISIVFIATSGEEAGLMGAEYFAEHPLIPLKKIKFLINLDMVGSGSEGITLVNGDQFPKAFQLMTKINADNEFIRQVQSRGESCNSDHCPFYKKGVPAIFIYSRGSESKHYHNIDDTTENLPLTEYNDIFRLLVQFVKKY